MLTRTGRAGAVTRSTASPSRTRATFRTTGTAAKRHTEREQLLPREFKHELIIGLSVPRKNRDGKRAHGARPGRAGRGCLVGGWRDGAPVVGRWRALRRGRAGPARAGRTRPGLHFSTDALQSCGKRRARRVSLADGPSVCYACESRRRFACTHACCSFDPARREVAAFDQQGRRSP